MRTFAVLALLVLAAARATAADPRSGSDLAAFTRHPQYVEALLSPRGTYVAAISMAGGQRRLLFVDPAARRVVSTVEGWRDAMVGHFVWVNDDVVLAEVWRQEGSLAAPISTGELVAVSARTGSQKFVFGFRAGERQTGSHIRRGERDLASASIVDPLRRGSGRHVLIAVRAWGTSDRIIRAFRLDVTTGVKDEVVASPIPEATFVTDENGAVRLARGTTADGTPKAFYREADGPWIDVSALRGITGHSGPVGFVARDRALYVVEPEGAGFRLDAVNVDTGERRLVSRNERVPPRSLAWDRPGAGRLFAVEYEPDLPVHEFPDPDHPLSRGLKGLLAAFPDDQVRLLNWTDDQKKALVFVYGERHPGSFMLLDVARSAVEPLFETRPWLRRDDLAEVAAFHVAASDGVLIHGYLTHARVTAPGTPPPLVVVPHGGPHGVRDHWEFHPDAQLLASRGFAVLQVNYRGSDGYGAAYQQAGYRQWGGRMIQDILDATRWAIRKGYADPKRVCVYGASFGGYAAMQASILAPELFRCAIGYAGVYDLALIQDGGDAAASARRQAFFRTVLGTDPDQLRAASPARNAARIAARVLLVHGKEDRRAPIEHAESLRDALAAAGNPSACLFESGEGHGFYDESRRERMYARILSFLEENTRAQPTQPTGPGADAARPAVTPP